MAADFKVLFFFQDDAQSLGWSEVHYWSGDTILNAQAAAFKLAQARVGLLSIGIDLKYIRCSGNDQPGTAHTYRQRLASLTAPLLRGSFSPATDSEDLAWSAMKIRITNNDGTIFRVQLVRGIPDVIWDLASDKVGRKKMEAPIARYIKALVDGHFQIRHLVRGNPARSYVPIAAGFYEGLTRRATGRPSYLPRGRRHKRA
jgi:hypothetical protein